jgi:hypothetical protein
VHISIQEVQLRVYKKDVEEFKRATKDLMHLSDVLSKIKIHNLSFSRLCKRHDIQPILKKVVSFLIKNSLIK